MDFLEAENIPYRQQSALNQPPQDARVFTTRREGLRCGTYLVRQSVNVSFIPQSYGIFSY